MAQRFVRLPRDFHKWPRIACVNDVREVVPGSYLDRRHIAPARVAVINALLDQEPVRELFETWGTRGGLLAEAEKLAAVRVTSRATINSAFGIQGDSMPSKQQHARMHAALASDDPKHQAARSALAAFASARITFAENVCAAYARHMNDAIRFALRYALDYPWLAVEVVAAFHRCLLAVAGQTVSAELWPQPDPPGATRFTFARRPGETPAEAVRRLSALVREVRRGLALEQRTPQGRRRLPKREGEPIAQWCQWLVRHRVGGESIRYLAMENHARQHSREDFADCDCRSTIKADIRKAEALLKTTRYRFASQ